MRGVLLAISTIVFACDKSDRSSGDDGSGIVVPGDDSGSSSGESGTSGSTGEIYAQGPYGQCEADPTCHCEHGTCVAPCTSDEECPGEASACISGGCYVDCTGYGPGDLTHGDKGLCDFIFADAESTTAKIACTPFDSTEIDAWICRWQPID